MRSLPLEPDISLFRIIITIHLEDVIDSKIITISSLPNVTILEKPPRHIFDAITLGSCNTSNLSVLHSQFTSSLNAPSRSYSLPGAATCKTWRLPSQSVLPTGTSQTKAMEFTNLTTLSRFDGIYLVLILTI